MSKIFGNDESDSDCDLKTNNQYAKNYNNWRQKEEFTKLKARYGDKVPHLEEDSSSSSSEDDEDAANLNEELEIDFFKTLASLKKKDPRIYDDSATFFSDTPVDSRPPRRRKREKPVHVNDHERNVILQHGGHFEASDDEMRPPSPTYVEQEKQLKASLKQALNANEDEDDDGDLAAGMFKKREKSTGERVKEEEDYKLWLKGQVDTLADQSTASDLKPLKEYWADPQLNDGEKFLRDYILNKRFLEEDGKDEIPTYEEIVRDDAEQLSEDEKQLEEQEEFEHKFNYRFEEPDQEFIKRYPRTVENSLRRPDDRRKAKRAEVKERKEQEKREKMDDLRRLRNLKRLEIEDKLKRLREITGNEEAAFDALHLDDDFDPDHHDRQMSRLFSDEFYEGPEGDQKPEFPDLDEEMEIERWDRYNPETGPGGQAQEDVHCEDEDFNMDADYDPATAFKQQLLENSKSKRKGRKKSKFLETFDKAKPALDSNDTTFQEYLDEYYKLDCEDIVGDVPCRFKYRKVIPNSYGLTVDEILRANDRELNRWCSLKKTVQHLPEHVEKYDQIAFEKKGRNEALKRKILPSLYAHELEETPTEKPAKKRNRGKNKGKQEEIEAKDEENVEKTIKKKKNKGNLTEANVTDAVNVTDSVETTDDQVTDTVETTEAVEVGDVKLKKKKKGKKGKLTETSTVMTDAVKTDTSLTETVNVTDAIKTSDVKVGDLTSKKRKNKGKLTEQTITDPVAVKTNNALTETVKMTDVSVTDTVKTNVTDVSVTATVKTNVTDVTSKKKKKGKKNAGGGKRKLAEGPERNAKKLKRDEGTQLSDARLQAYGIKPKKFKNKLKYGSNRA